MRNVVTNLSPLLLAVILLLTPGVQAAAVPDGFETWTSDTYGITLTYPEDWSIDERPETYDVPCILDAPSTTESGGEGSDAFGAFIMPVFIGEGYFDDIKTLTSAWEDKFKSDWRDDWDKLSISNGLITETADGHPAYELHYEVTDVKDFRIRWDVLLVLTRENKKAWVVGYCARDSFDDFLPEAREILRSAEFSD